MDDSILVVDDERDFLESVRRGLITSGFRNVRIEEDPRRAIDFFENGEEFDAALIDINMTPINGVEVLRAVKRLSPDTECVMVSALDEARLAVSCLKQGAYDYLVKPVSKEDLVSTVGRALEHRRLIRIMEIGKGWDLPRIDNQAAFEGIVAQSPNMLRVLKEAELHAARDIPVLVTGETGTGKELIARAIHAASPRAAGPFTAVNMESLNPTLFESQFFGFPKGAFTGAASDYTGYLEAAERGTLLLDEIGYMPVEMQGKLLRVLQEGEYYKIGTNVPKKVNVRFIAATNADLQRLMAKGLFRKDLFYRLRGGWLHLPPLRERRDDIPLLLKRFTAEFCGEDEWATRRRSWRCSRPMTSPRTALASLQNGTPESNTVISGTFGNTPGQNGTLAANPPHATFLPLSAAASPLNHLQCFYSMRTDLPASTTGTALAESG